MKAALLGEKSQQGILKFMSRPVFKNHRLIIIQFQNDAAQHYESQMEAVNMQHSARLCQRVG